MWQLEEQKAPYLCTQKWVEPTRLVPGIRQGVDGVTMAIEVYHLREVEGRRGRFIKEGEKMKALYRFRSARVIIWRTQVEKSSEITMAPSPPIYPSTSLYLSLNLYLSV